MSKTKALAAFERLLTIMDTLRAECPWDRKQTIQTLRHLTLEEVYELSDAILENDFAEIKKELGDVLLHLVFYAKIASEQGHFDMADAVEALNEKLIRRHPHIYGETKVENEEEVKQNWEKIKLQEGNRSVLAGVPKGLPALVKAMRMQEKAQGVGFDFATPGDAWAKVEEELAEFRAEEDLEKQSQEFGDVLFSLVNYARLRGINPDEALERTNRKFQSRFEKMEEMMLEKGMTFDAMTLTEMDEFWERAKAEIAKK